MCVCVSRSVDREAKKCPSHCETMDRWDGQSTGQWLASYWVFSTASGPVSSFCCLDTCIWFTAIMIMPFFLLYIYPVLALWCPPLPHGYSYEASLCQAVLSCHLYVATACVKGLVHCCLSTMSVLCQARSLWSDGCGWSLWVLATVEWLLYSSTGVVCIRC